MRIQTGVRRYNVRCCCQPTKILGTLELSERQVSLAASPAGMVIYFAPPFGLLEEPPFAGPRTERIFMKQYTEDGRSEIAVYSDDRPLEFWRGVKGFVEQR